MQKPVVSCKVTKVTRKSLPRAHAALPAREGLYSGAPSRVPC
jgi:hypothetical protein